MRKQIQMKGKSANRCSGGGGDAAFSSPCDDDAPHSHQLLHSQKKSSRICSWSHPLLRMKMRGSYFSTCLGMMLLTFTLLLQIGCTFGAAANPSTTTDLPNSSSSISSSHNNGGGHQKCYVCLPPDKSSSEAQDISKLFKDAAEHKIPDCAGFSSSQNKKAYEFKCPTGYQGCLLRIHGANVSRSCAQFQFNDCRVANSKELCFCTGSLCNSERESITSLPISAIGRSGSSSSSSSSGETISSEERSRETLAEEQEESESRKFFQKGETDDEDLLEMADDTGSSGDGPYPPGVIDAYTTTPKPTLVPNIRGDRVKTTPAPVTTASGAPRRPSSVASYVSSLLFLFLGSYLSCHLVNMHDRP